MNKSITYSLVALLIIAVVGFVLLKNKNGDNSLPQYPKGEIIQTSDKTIVKLSVDQNGTYDPKTIKVKAGTKIRIEGNPDTLFGPMETIVIDGYGLTKTITPEDNILEFTADKNGEFQFNCANGMGDGLLIVE